MIVERYNGWIILSTLHQGYLVTRKYQGYTTKEAKQLFRNELKGVKP